MRLGRWENCRQDQDLMNKIKQGQLMMLDWFITISTSNPIKHGMTSLRDVQDGLIDHFQGGMVSQVGDNQQMD